MLCDADFAGRRWCGRGGGEERMMRRLRGQPAAAAGVPSRQLGLSPRLLGSPSRLLLPSKRLASALPASRQATFCNGRRSDPGQSQCRRPFARRVHREGQPSHPDKLAALFLWDRSRPTVAASRQCASSPRPKAVCRHVARALARQSRRLAAHRPRRGGTTEEPRPTLRTCGPAQGRGRRRLQGVPPAGLARGGEADQGLRHRGL